MPSGLPGLRPGSTRASCAVGMLAIGANAAASRHTIVATEAEIAGVGADSYTPKAALALLNSSGLT